MTSSSPDLEAHRPLLLAHCYQMLASPHDAADAVQETMIRAMRGLSGFLGETSLRRWMVRIATRVCLDMLRQDKRRARYLTEWPGAADDALTMAPADAWVEPIPDAWIVSPDNSPDEQVIQRQQVRLAFIAALQQLTPRQRAALLLSQVVGWRAAEIAQALETSVGAVNSALQRARAQLDQSALSPADVEDDEGAAVEPYISAFEAYDVDALTALLTDDVKFSMPPVSLWLQGPEQVAAFLRGPGHACEGSVLLRTRANGRAALGQYRDGGRLPWGLVTLETRGGRVAGITTYLNVGSLFPLFGLPSTAQKFTQKMISHR